MSGEINQRDMDDQEVLEAFFKATDRQKELRNDLEVRREEAEKAHQVLREQDDAVEHLAEIAIDRFPSLSNVARQRWDANKVSSAGIEVRGDSEARQYRAGFDNADGKRI